MSTSAVVFGQCSGESVTTASIGDEVEKIRLGRVQNRLYRGPTGIGNWPRWKAFVHIGVVGRRLLEIAFAQGSIQPLRINSIGHRRVGLQSHPAFEPVEEYTGNQRPLFR